MGRIEEIDQSSCSSKEMTRPYRGSMDILINGRGIKTHNQPVVGNINMTKSSGTHMGPEIPHIMPNNANVKKDISFHRYLYTTIKNLTKYEKLCCAAGMLVLITSIALTILYFTTRYMIDHSTPVSEEPGWFINRKMWGATTYDRAEKTKFPLGLVIIAHTVSTECIDYVTCTGAVKSIQDYYLNIQGYDIPYSFLIGGDGRVYEGRGWNTVGAHTLRYNNCSVGVGFIGDYRTQTVTNLQQKRAHMLFKKGVLNGNLHHEFHVVGHKDLRPTESPGTNLYEAIRQWPQYNHENIYQNLNCQQIDELFKV